jgi:hypothetical protein
VTSILWSAFYWCRALTAITIPAGITYLGGMTFGFCSQLTSVTFAAGSQLETLRGDTFYSCDSLIAISIPASVRDIDGNPFAGCASLATIIVEGTDSPFAVEGNILWNKETGELIAWPMASGDESLVYIPNVSITKIGASAFLFNQFLESLEIPATVTEIGYEAFRGCGNLTDITFFAEGLKIIGNFAFVACTGITSITIPITVESIGTGAFYAWTSSQTINVPGRTEAQAIAAWDDYGWLNECEANIVYAL